MKLNILMPFHRPSFIPILLNMLQSEDVIWHPIADLECEFPKLPWIKPVWLYPPQDWMPTGGCCYWKVNEWVRKHIPVDDEHYTFLCDDDGFDPGYYKTLKNMSGDIIITSMHHYPGRDLIACKENMRVGHVGFEQLVFKGSTLKQVVFDNSCIADGMMAEKIVRRFNNIVYTDKCFIRFNALRPDWRK